MIKHRSGRAAYWHMLQIVASWQNQTKLPMPENCQAHATLLCTGTKTLQQETEQKWIRWNVSLLKTSTSEFQFSINSSSKQWSKDSPTWLPSQSNSITAPWPVRNYTAWWQRHTVVISLPKVTMQWCPARTSTRDLLPATFALPIAPPYHVVLALNF